MQEAITLASAAGGSEETAAICQATSRASSLFLSGLLGPGHHVPWLAPPRQLALCPAMLRAGLRGVRSQRLDGEPLSSATVEGGYAFEKRWRDHSWTWLYAAPGSCGGPVLWEPWCH